MFKLVDTYVIERDFEIEVPVAGKKYEKTILKLEVELLPLAEIKRLVDDGLDDVALLKRVIVGWPTSPIIADEDGQPLEFSDEARDRLAALPFASTALARQYLELITRAPRKT